MQTVAESIHEHNHPSGATDALPAGTVIADRYRLDEIIARGGMATVWRGHDLRLGRDVAVKLCPPGAPGASLQIREEHFSSALLHPNVVAIFDAGDIAEPEPGAGNAFIVMEPIRSRRSRGATLSTSSARQPTDLQQPTSAGSSTATSSLATC
jgi:hypothetical protein